MDQVTIETARIDRASEIVCLLERSYRGDLSKKGWTSEADLIDGVRTSQTEIFHILSDVNAHTLVAVNNDDCVIGCITIYDFGTHCEFGKFAVDPEQQAQGIGKFLLAEAEITAVAQFAATKMHMHVISGRLELEAFYERRGYIRTGNTVKMADIHTAVEMTKGHNLILNEYAKHLV